MMSVAELVEALEQEREDHALTAWVLWWAVDSETDDDELDLYDVRFAPVQMRETGEWFADVSVGWEEAVDEQRTGWRRHRREVRVPLDADGRPRWTIEARQLIRAVQQFRREYRK